MRSSKFYWQGAAIALLMNSAQFSGAESITIRLHAEVPLIRSLISSTSVLSNPTPAINQQNGSLQLNFEPMTISYAVSGCNCAQIKAILAGGSIPGALSMTMAVMDNQIGNHPGMPVAGTVQFSAIGDEIAIIEEIMGSTGTATINFSANLAMDTMPGAHDWSIVLTLVDKS